MAGFVAGQTCRVMYDFNAEDASELSVRAGELVVVTDANSAAADGWLAVHRQADAFARGFVPSEYVVALTPQVASPNSSAPTPASSGLAAPIPVAALPAALSARDSPDASAAGSSVRGGSAMAEAAATPLPSSRGAGYAVDYSSAVVPAASSGAEHGGSPSSSGVHGGGASGGAGLQLQLASLPQEYAQLFANHEEWFRAATARRADAYRHLLGDSMDLVRALAESEARSKGLLARVSELEGLIADERAKWGAAQAAAAPSSAAAAAAAAAHSAAAAVISAGGR